MDARCALQNTNTTQLKPFFKPGRRLRGQESVHWVHWVPRKTPLPFWRRKHLCSNWAMSRLAIWPSEAPVYLVRCSKPEATIGTRRVPHAIALPGCKSTAQHRPTHMPSTSPRADWCTDWCTSDAMGPRWVWVPICIVVKVLH